MIALALRKNPDITANLNRAPRPRLVTLNGAKTCCLSGADGSRVKKIEGLAAGTACPVGTITGSRVTAYFAGVEVRSFRAGAAFEEIHIYPYADLRITKTNADGGAVESAISWLHRDGLASVRGVTGQDGLMDERATYRPFGEAVSVDADPSAKNESKGWIGRGAPGQASSGRLSEPSARSASEGPGQRYDADAGLQFLNARYYDPKLGSSGEAVPRTDSFSLLIIQPDWWEVTEPGVGTNRYSYAFNDPIGASDPSGHETMAYSIESTMTVEESDINGILKKFNRPNAENAAIVALNAATGPRLPSASNGQHEVSINISDSATIGLASVPIIGEKSKTHMDRSDGYYPEYDGLSGLERIIQSTSDNMSILVRDEEVQTVTIYVGHPTLIGYGVYEVGLEIGGQHVTSGEIPAIEPTNVSQTVYDYSSGTYRFISSNPVSIINAAANELMQLKLKF